MVIADGGNWLWSKGMNNPFCSVFNIASRLKRKSNTAIVRNPIIFNSKEDAEFASPLLLEYIAVRMKKRV